MRLILPARLHPTHPKQIQPDTVREALMERREQQEAEQSVIAEAREEASAAEPAEEGDLTADGPPAGSGRYPGPRTTARPAKNPMLRTTQTFVRYSPEIELADSTFEAALELAIEESSLISRPLETPVGPRAVAVMRTRRAMVLRAPK